MQLRFPPSSPLSNSAANVATRLLLAIVGIFLLAVFAAVVWRLRLAHEVNARLASLRAAGLPTSGAELDKWYAAVPDSENAALVITQACALLANYADVRSNQIAEFKMPPRGQRLTTEQRQLLAGYVELNAAALAKTREAVRLPRSRYPVTFAAGIQELPHLAGIKSLARIAEFEALVAGDSSRGADMDADLVTILGLARTLDDEPLPISQLMHMALLQMATDTLARRLIAGQTGDAECEHLGLAFSSAERTNAVVGALIGDRAQFLPYAQWFRQNAGEVLPGEKRDGPPLPLPPMKEPPPKWCWLTGYFTRDLRFYLDFIETNIALAALPMPASLSAVERYGKEAGRDLELHPHLLSATFLPAVGMVLTREAQSLVRVRAAEAALAVERFRLAEGRLPESLAQLSPRFLPSVPTDPFDGAPLKYRRLATGYVVYSVDRDLHDDAGREKPANWTAADTNSYDLTFTVER